MAEVAGHEEDAHYIHTTSILLLARSRLTVACLVMSASDPFQTLLVVECLKLKARHKAIRERPSVQQTREPDAVHVDVYKNYTAGMQRGLTAKEMEKTMA